MIVDTHFPTTCSRAGWWARSSLPLDPILTFPYCWGLRNRCIASLLASRGSPPNLYFPYFSLYWEHVLSSDSSPWFLPSRPLVLYQVNRTHHPKYPTAWSRLLKVIGLVLCARTTNGLHYLIRLQGPLHHPSHRMELRDKSFCFCLLVSPYVLL